MLEGVRHLLTPGGELYFSDVYADRRVPESLREDPVLYGECLGGALYWNDFLRLAGEHGFTDPRLVEDRPLAVTDPTLADRLEGVDFYSATYRLFKIDELEPACEDYGQAVIYRGTVAESPTRFVLDKHHDIEAGQVFPVCGNTWRMLRDSASSLISRLSATSGGTTASSRAVAAPFLSTPATHSLCLALAAERLNVQTDLATTRRSFV